MQIRIFGGHITSRKSILLKNEKERFSRMNANGLKSEKLQHQKNGKLHILMLLFQSLLQKIIWNLL